MTKNNRMPKISILLQFGGEILTLLCYDESHPNISLGC